MSALPPEQALFPEGLLDAPGPLEMEGRSWWALHTLPRQEKSLARDLIGLQVPFYLPLIVRNSVVRRRIISAHVPLFPGYLFLMASHEERLAVLGTGRVARTLSVAEPMVLWRDLRQIQRMLDSGDAIAPEQRLLPGMAVEIISGPMAGLRGRILRTASGRRFVVALHFMQQGVSALLDDFTLTRVEPDDVGFAEARARSPR